MNFLRKSDVKLANRIVLQIPLLEFRRKYWEELIRQCYSTNMHSVTDMFGLQIESATDDSVFRRELISALYVSDCSKSFFIDHFHLVRTEMNQCEEFLYKYALNSIYSHENISEEIIRLNKSLQLQWAIDIKN